MAVDEGPGSFYFRDMFQPDNDALGGVKYKSDAELLSVALPTVNQLSVQGLQQLFDACAARLSRLLDPLCGTRLPRELQDRVLGLLSPVDLANCRLVCSRWRRRIDHDNGLWLRLGRRLGLRDDGNHANHHFDKDNHCLDDDSHHLESDNHHFDKDNHRFDDDNHRLDDDNHRRQGNSHQLDNDNHHESNNHRIEEENQIDGFDRDKFDSNDYNWDESDRDDVGDSARRRVRRLLGESYLACSEVAFGPDLGAPVSDGEVASGSTVHDQERALVGLTAHSAFSNTDAELLLDYFEPETQRVRFRRLHVRGFAPAGRANANARANGYCPDSKLAVLVAGPAGGGLHAVVSLADAATTLTSVVDAAPLAFIRMTDGERVSATAAHVCGECGCVQILLLTSLNRLLLWCLPLQSPPPPAGSHPPPPPPLLQVPDAAATLHSDAGDLFRRNRLISIGPVPMQTKPPARRRYYYAALTRRESLVTLVEIGCRTIQVTDRLMWPRPLKGFLRWRQPASADCQLVTMAIETVDAGRCSALRVVPHRVAIGNNTSKLVTEESVQYESAFQTEDLLLCGYGAKCFAILGISATAGLGLALHRPGWPRPLAVIQLSNLFQMVLLEPLCVPLPAPWAAPRWFDDGLDASSSLLPSSVGSRHRQPLLLLATGTRGHLLLSWRFGAPSSEEIEAGEAVERVLIRQDFVHPRVQAESCSDSATA